MSGEGKSSETFIHRALKLKTYEIIKRWAGCWEAIVSNSRIYAECSFSVQYTREVRLICVYDCYYTAVCMGGSSCSNHWHNMVHLCHAFKRNMLSLCSHCFGFGKFWCNFKSNCYHVNIIVCFLFSTCTTKAGARQGPKVTMSKMCSSDSKTDTGAWSWSFYFHSKEKKV